MPDTVPPESTAIRDHLLADHRSIEDILERLQVALASDDRENIQDLWTRFEAHLLAHLELEERELIPTLATSFQRDARALLEEHRHIRARLLELGTSIDLHTIRLNVARTFMDDLRAHSRHEDQLLYRRADSQADEAKPAKLFAQLAAAVEARLTQLRSPH